VDGSKRRSSRDWLGGRCESPLVVIGSLSYFPAHGVRRSAGSYLASFELSPSHYCPPWSTAQAGDPSVKVAKLLFTVADLAGFQAFHLVFPTAGYQLLPFFGPTASGSVVSRLIWW
jgi:hypothetical protein